MQKKDLCVQIRFFYRLHRGSSGRGSRMLCHLSNYEELIILIKIDASTLHIFYCPHYF
jgi:hypothetical protein